MDGNNTPDQNTTNSQSKETSLSLPTPKPIVETVPVAEKSVPLASSPVLTIPTPQTQPVLSTDPPTSSINLLLQWLMYAFYGWSLIAFSYLITATVYYYLNGRSSDIYGSAAPYAVVATVILLGIAVACNKFYEKQEPQPKKGPAAVIMIIHAVIFAIFGIIALIAAIFVIVDYLLSGSGDGSVAWSGVISGLLIFVLYALTFLRTINLSKLKWLFRFYMWGMIGVAAILCILALVGPSARAFRGKNDQLIQNNLEIVTAAISDKTNTDGALPDSLNALSLNGDTSKLVKNKLLTYIPNSLSNSDQNNYYYEICVKYALASPGYKASMGKNQNASEAANYSSYPNTYDHPSGNYCYLISILGNNYDVYNLNTSSSYSY